jgi:hypothetical protein
LSASANADYRAFGNIWMRRPDFLDLPRGEAMSGDIDDVVGSGHHVDVAVAVDEPGIGGAPDAREILRRTEKILAKISNPDRVHHKNPRSFICSRSKPARIRRAGREVAG